MFYTDYRTKHYYNNLLSTPWPFCISICLFHIVFLTILILNKYLLISLSFSTYVLLLIVYLFIESIIAWFLEIIEESFYGKYSKKLKSALLFGFVLFLISEAMLFGSFFWVYFDRLFHLSYVTGYLSVPSSVESIRWFKEPIYATLILITSGYTCNYSYYLYKCSGTSTLVRAYSYSLLTNILGVCFLYIQYVEYNHLNFTISDTVYCSVFYLLTGFHGIHVIIGNLFLFVQYLLKVFYIDNKVFGLSLALIYWHFVDVIWIFLFIFVYAFNNIDYLLVKSELSLEVLLVQPEYVIDRVVCMSCNIS